MFDLRRMSDKVYHRMKVEGKKPHEIQLRFPTSVMKPKSFQFLINATKLLTPAVIKGAFEKTGILPAIHPEQYPNFKRKKASFAIDDNESVVEIIVSVEKAQVRS